MTHDSTDRTGRTDRSDEHTYRVVGLMSGTSLDGVDAACCRITTAPHDDPFGATIESESFVTRSYETDLREQLVTVCDDETGTVDEVCRLNVSLAEVFAEIAREAWREAGHDATDVDLIASHGQSVWHIPDNESLPGTDRRSRSTLQIGSGSVIAERTGVRTVSDFRMADIAAGGHGAPLAPFADATLFADETAVRSIQNIGGIGNCALLVPTPDRDDIRAFDTGPGNMVIDAVVEILTDGAQTFDEDGELAAAGTVDSNLVEAFLDDEYFREEPPKSTGREYFGHDYARQFIEAGRDRNLDGDDIIASATALTARSIADAYDRFAPTYPDEVYVSGGGAYNPTLMSMLSSAVDAPVARLRELGVDGDQKEAFLFALLGATCMDGIPNNVPSATGADRPVVMGQVSKP
jgi:anhydro-N-acetylmuramic acid kinase